MSLPEVLRRAQDLGLFGPGPVAQQQAHADAFVALVLGHVGSPSPRAFLDLGSGGGLPGLVLALALPDATGTLLDSQRRRTDFLTDAVGSLGLAERIVVLQARAEDAARDEEHRGHYDLVVARSFGAPAVTAECGVGFLRAGGTLAVSEPPGGTPSGGTAEDRWPAEPLRTLGFDPPEVRSDGAASAAMLRLPQASADRWPRRAGMPAKRPVW